MRFSWVQDSSFYISCDIFKYFAVVPRHIEVSSVKYLEAVDIALVVVYALLELLFLGALHKLPDVLRDFFAFFFRVAHRELFKGRSSRNRTPILRS